MSVIMYRGLTTNQQVGDRYGRSTTGIAASLASSNNVTSNGEYGGWFGQSSISYPALSRAKSETVWRTGGNTTAVNTASIQDIMQLLKQGQSPRPVMANVTRSGPNGLRLVGSRTNPSVQQGAPHPGSSTGPVAAPSQSSQENQPEERFQQSGEHLATTNHLPSNGSAKRWPVGAAEIPNADPTNVPKVNGMQQPQQRGFNGHSPAAYQRLAGSLPSDQNRVMKSATTLGFASERSDAAPDEQNNRNFASNFRTPGPNVPGNRNIYNAGSVPTWRNRWSQGHPLYRPGQPPVRAGPMTTNEAIYRPEPAAHLSTPNGGPNVQGTVQFNTNNGHSASWQSAGSADDLGNAVLANRLREDRAHFHPDCRVNSKLETVTAVDFMPAAKQRPGAHANFSDENASKLGRYGLGPAFERNNPSYPLRLVPEGFRSDGSGMAQSNGSMYSHLDHENKLEKSHLAPGTSEETVARSPGHASVSTPRLGTNCAQGPASSPRLGTNCVQGPASSPRLGTNCVQGPASSPRLGTNCAQGPASTLRMGTNCAQGSEFSASPKRSILKKPKIQSTDYESGIVKRRMEQLYPTRHSAGSVTCFNGLSYAGQAASGVDSFQNQRQDSNQKRVTFKLDK